MKTSYQPTSTTGETGPVFQYLTLACLWIVARDDSHLWDARAIRSQVSAAS